MILVKNSTQYEYLIFMYLHQRPSSTNWKELRDFAFVNVKEPDMRDDDGGTKWRMPFLHKVPPFPVHVRRSEAPVSENVTGNGIQNSYSS